MIFEIWKHILLPHNGPSVKEAPIFGQVKYLMHFCVRKLRIFLGFYFTDLLKSDKKYYHKYLHLHLWEHIKIKELWR
jgi:hypothetical protein